MIADQMGVWTRLQTDDERDWRLVTKSGISVLEPVGGRWGHGEFEAGSRQRSVGGMQDRLDVRVAGG